MFWMQDVDIAVRHPTDLEVISENEAMSKIELSEGAQENVLAIFVIVIRRSDVLNEKVRVHEKLDAL